MDQGSHLNHTLHDASAGSAAALFVLFVVLPLILLAAYVVAARRERKAANWCAWRIASFALGIGLVITAMAPPISNWAHGDLRGHMVQHLLLGMFAPLALALAAPGTLLLRNVSVSNARNIVAFLDTAPMRILTHPIVAALLDIGGMHVLYLTPLFSVSMNSPIAHVLLHVHFLVSGYLFTWSIAGPDPAPHRPGMRMRLAVLFLATAAHSILGKLMYGYGFPRGAMADVGEVRAAAQWMYYGGDVAELLLAVAFFALWFRRRSGLPDFLSGRLRSPT
jgi:putative membrane protein